MDESKDILARIEQLEKRVALLETRMDNQYEATQSVIRRIAQLENKGRLLERAKAAS